jgi:hypothetical protein
MGLLILRRKDSGTRNCFLGESSGPYIWGKEKCTLGISGRQEDLISASGDRMRAHIQCFPLCQVEGHLESVVEFGESGWCE